MAGWRLVEGRRDVLGVRLPAPPAPQGKPVGRAVPRCGAGAIARGARQLARPYRAGAGGVAVLGLHRHQRAQRAGRGDSRPARVRGHHRGLGRAAGDRHAVATLHAPVVPRPAPEGRPCDLRRYPDALALAAPARGGQLRPEHRRDGRGRRRHSQPGVAAAVPQSLHPFAAPGGGRGGRVPGRPSRRRVVAGRAGGFGGPGWRVAGRAVRGAVDGGAGRPSGGDPGDPPGGSRRGRAHARLRAGAPSLGRRFRANGRQRGRGPWQRAVPQSAPRRRRLCVRPRQRPPGHRRSPRWATGTDSPHRGDATSPGRRFRWRPMAASWPPGRRGGGMEWRI
jgi:hypothetical protein